MTEEWKEYSEAQSHEAAPMEEVAFCHGDYQYHNILSCFRYLCTFFSSLLCFSYSFEGENAMGIPCVSEGSFMLPWSLASIVGTV